METRLLIAGIAVLFGFVAIYAATYAGAVAMRRRNAAIAAQEDEGFARGVVAWRMRNGFATLTPLARVALRNVRIRTFAQDMVELAESHGTATSCEPLLTVVAVALVAVGVIAGLVSGSAVGSIACPACLVCVLAVVVGNAKDRHQEEVREAVPNALESMAVCFGSGFTLLQTFRQVAQDTPGPLGDTFARSAHVLEMGGSAEKSLANLREGAEAPELAFVAVALDVQHQAGGAMKQVLDAASDTVKGELALRRSLRVQTAQAKLSARVVVVMPFILVAAFSLASPDFLAPFFASPAGYALLTLALVMQLAGVVLVRRALSVDGVA